MQDLRTAALMALEALEQVDPHVDRLVDYSSTASEWELNLVPRSVVQAINALRAALAAEPEPVAKLWLWMNFVDGRPEYWAFDNPFPVHMDCGDPQTLGEPVGYALVKPSRNGRPDVTDAEVLRRIATATPTAKPLTDEEIATISAETGACIDVNDPELVAFVRGVERAHGIGGKT